MSLKRLEEIVIGQDMYGHVIGVHYKGNGSYQTKLGAFVTLTTYILMTVNLVTLLMAFNDGSNQDEKFQGKKIDRFASDSDVVKLNENEYTFAMFVYPPVPEEVGSLTAYQCYDGVCANNTNLEIGPCAEELSE